MKTDRQDAYTRVTNLLIADLEKGVRPWLKPWNAEHMAGKITCPLRSNGQPYKGVNVLMLWASAAAQGFSAPIWMTFKQAKELDAHVMKGAKGSLVVFADRFTRTETAEDGQEIERQIPFMKGYTVFNVEQIEGLPAHYYAVATPKLDPAARIAAAEQFFANTGIEVRHGGNQAYYSQASDHVQIPSFEAFRDPESYYATLAHEATHATKHPDRLDRDFGRKRFGDEGYAREELVAEIGSAFLCCELGITPTPREDHASYLDHWLKVLKADNRAIFQAASHAQKAADYLSGLQQPMAHAAAGQAEPGPPLPSPGDAMPMPTVADILADPKRFLSPEQVQVIGNGHGSPGEGRDNGHGHDGPRRGR